MPKFMEEVMDLLNSIMESNIIIQTGNFSQEIKDEVRRITDVALNEVLEQTSDLVIAREIAKEWRKNH